MKKLMLSETWLYRYRYVFGYTILVLLGIFALFYRLGTLLPGINWLEASSASRSMNLGDLLLYPVDFIYHFLQYISISLLGPTAFAIRLPGVIIAILTVGLFFYVIEHRFTKRAAIITTLLLVSSSWFLNVTRLGSTSTLTMFFILALIFLSTKLDDKYSLLWFLLFISTAALSLYSPYFIYLLIAGVLLSLPSIRSSARSIKNRDLYIGGGLFLLLITPLIILTIRDYAIAKELLALPDSFPSPAQYFQNVMDAMGYIIWKSELFPILHLGTLPMLEIFSVSMVALGLYHYDHELSKNLSRLVLGGLLFTIILVAVNGNQLDYALLLPFIYFILAGGLVILFTQWNEIFPKNPLARVIAIVPITILLLIVVNYNVERYFVAWPNNPEVIVEHSEAYTKIYDELEQNAAYTAVLNSTDEIIVMGPLNVYYPAVMFVSDIEKVSKTGEERRLLITDEAYNELSGETKKQLGVPSRTIPSEYRSRSAVLWVYDVSL